MSFDYKCLKVVLSETLNKVGCFNIQNKCKINFTKHRNCFPKHLKNLTLGSTFNEVYFKVS